jgi:hypothetical protein
LRLVLGREFHQLRSIILWLQPVVVVVGHTLAVAVAQVDSELGHLLL